MTRLPKRSLQGPALLLAALVGFAFACTSAPTPTAPPAAAIDSVEAVETFEAAWKEIDESHFDPTFNGVDWEAVREELRPRAASATTEAELRGVIRDMLGRLDQSHFGLIPRDAVPALSDPEEADDGRSDVAGGCGLDLRLRDGELLVTRVDAGGPAAAAGVATGWVLERVGSRRVSDIVQSFEEVEDDLGARRAAYSARAQIVHATHGEVGSSVELAFRDGDDEEVEVTVERTLRDVVSHDFGNLPTFHLRFESGVLEHDGKRIGRIHFTNWFLPMVKPIDEALHSMRGCHGILIDLRGNSGGAGAMTMGMAGHFFDERRTLGTQSMRKAQMKYVAMPRKVSPDGTRVKPFDCPVAILVDETTASASEIFAGGMQSVGRARVFGETSAGAVLPARTSQLPNGDALLHAIGDFKTADGTMLEHRGVIPDEIHELNRADLLRGEDRQLEAALDWLVRADNPYPTTP